MSLVINDLQRTKEPNELIIILNERFRKASNGDIIRVVWGGAVNKTRYYMLVSAGGIDNHLVNLETGHTRQKFHRGGGFCAWFTDFNGNLLIEDLAIAKESEISIKEYHDE